MPKVEITENLGLVQRSGNGDVAFGLETATHGAGAIGTEIAPSTRVSQINDEVVTTIKLDLTGLKKVSDVGDVIGLDGINGAYLLQYNSSTHGILYKATLSVLELPTGTNVLRDFDLIAHASATKKYNDDVASGGTVLLASGGALAAGQTVKSLQIGSTGATSGHYIYLAEGDTSSDAQLFTAGKLLIKLYGHKLF